MKTCWDYLQEKTSVIVAGNTEELAKITDEEQNVVSKINRLEKKRQEVLLISPL